MGHLDRNAASLDRLRRNQQRMRAGGATSDVRVALPLRNDGSQIRLDFVQETPAGTIDGTNAAFVLTDAPVAGTLMVFVNGLLMTGDGNDYTLAAKTVTFVAGAVPETGDMIRVAYVK